MLSIDDTGVTKVASDVRLIIIELGRIGFCAWAKGLRAREETVSKPVRQ